MDTTREGTGGSAGCEGYEKTGGTRKKLIADHRAALIPFLRILRARRRERSFLYYTIAATRSASILSRSNDGDGKSELHRSCAGVRLLRVHARAIPRERGEERERESGPVERR